MKNESRTQWQDAEPWVPSGVLELGKWVEGCCQRDDLGLQPGSRQGNKHFLVVEATKLFKLYRESLADAISFGIPLVEGGKSLADLWAWSKWPSLSITVESGPVASFPIRYRWCLFMFQILCCLSEPNVSFSWTSEFFQAESFSEMLVGCLSVRFHS